MEEPESRRTSADLLAAKCRPPLGEKSLMRIFCILLFLVGLAIGVIWPWAQRHFGGEEIGTWVLYQREGGYQSAKVQLKPEDAPLRIFVDAQPMQGVTSGQ